MTTTKSQDIRRLSICGPSGGMIGPQAYMIKLKVRKFLLTLGSGLANVQICFRILATHEQYEKSWNLPSIISNCQGLWHLQISQKH